MKALLLYPQFPQSFWSYDRFMEIAGLKAAIPPLGIITVAALLPQDWEIRFCDRNVNPETETDWEWCDLVILSAMLVQKADFHALIRKAANLGKPVAVGGPYPTSVPQAALDSGANYLILDEGENTVPQFLEAIAQGQTHGIFRSPEKPDVTQSPVPRFDLLQRDAYLMMAIQFSRGCPFNCEFCDIIALYGRKPRTKEPSQTLTELQALYDLGWRGSLFIVDDNFIGNQRNVKRLLRELIPWMEERRYPFTFITEASVNLAEDRELLDLMAQAGFYAVFLGIETPDQDSLQVTRKLQNTRNPLVEACRKINQAGLLIYAGFILGFDGERSGAGDRIQAFVEQTSIPQPMLGILQALPNTALWNRLQAEQRLLDHQGAAVGDQNTLMNFVPTRPISDVAQEYLKALWTLYEPANYLSRCYQQCLQIVPYSKQKQTMQFSPKQGLRLVAQLIWHQGLRRAETRKQFWQQLGAILYQKPQVLNMYLGLCAAGEHFWEYRVLARDRITQQLGYDPLYTSPSLEASPVLVH
ncbi:B12-binding domain-containing radical SAM protein [Desertifilum sp. FACHB-1129]|uniref:B12-binding domain-containing radical SAM protein n=1 Tax=Desertifilum tharense IPPAS B-1220 TaxID=1781255 RepID=A0A1E5QK19_9CYAN|nr:MULTISPECIES: radical SAM protein [Desertifilum]MDA0210464.1 radical SAM protein [Cyanobacteria bacterium FC1]MBD2313899.1 B12-binding domain-containing radical SAM protein [Desertifilum sp. FACHB-1129]MBD2324730.1 B12-binding domain-containing radical SAM protein [Desertifilum sp. FACHB-866]MBD2334876.1 B12-binding domain-containing radical SAM protein [Desertifilum sp. FACHB-868]OEJ75022.1 B12-binding domain-containing radical SAM protein [Desertifilum tharense IPPAS B-1220]